MLFYILLKIVTLKIILQMTTDTQLRIYWVVTIGPKGQVIIPKEARENFDVKESLELDIATIDRTGFGIWSHENIKRGCEVVNKVVEYKWVVNIGTKFQFVIPSSVRSMLEIWPKDNLLVIGKWCVWIWFIKNDKIEYVLNYINYIRENS